MAKEGKRAEARGMKVETACHILYSCNTVLLIEFRHGLYEPYQSSYKGTKSLQ